MAEKTLNTRILLKYDTYSNWTSKNPVLKAGEVAIATIASGSTQAVNSVTPPQVLIKVGDGTSNYNSLPFASGLAADVYSWAKQTGLSIAKDGTGNVVSGIEWDASANNGKGGIKFTTAAVATAEGLGELQETVAGISRTIADNSAAWAKDDNTTYTFAKSQDGKSIVVTPSSGNASTISFAFLTETEVKNVIKGYGYATQTALTNLTNYVGTFPVVEGQGYATVVEYAEYIADAEANEALSTAIGYTGDTADTNTIYGAKAAAKAAKDTADAKVASVAAGDGTITIGGTATAPTVKVTANTFDAYGAAAAVLGTSGDAATANTVYGAKAAAAAAQQSANNAQGEVDALELDVGNVDSLGTQNKTVVSAINEVLAAVGAGGTAAAITIEKSADGLTYTVKQGNTTVGTIDIPKDMVVTAGEVVTNPSGQPAGTYIKLTLANVTNPLYINVGTLVDIYKAKANAAQVQVAIDSSTREISASIVAGSIGSTELADSAVVTAKIADANVTKTKLATTVQTTLDRADSAIQRIDGSDQIEATQNENTYVLSLKTGSINKALLATDVQTSLGKADSAVQSVTEGSTNGTISVDGTAVSVHGLGSAAYTASTAYATSAQGSKADTAVQPGDLGTMAKETATNYVKKTDAPGYGDILTKTSAASTYATKAFVGQLPQEATSTDVVHYIDEVGEAAKSYAEDYADELDRQMEVRVSALEGDRHNHSNKTVLDGISAEDIQIWDTGADLAASAIQHVEAGTGLKVSESSTSARKVEFDDSVTFIFNCGNATF